MLSQQPVIRQEQRLKMTPQLYQAIRIMAMPLQELQTSIQEELERNPALEVVEDNTTTSLDTDPRSGSEEEPLQPIDRPREYRTAQDIDPGSGSEESRFAESSDPGYVNGSHGADADAKRQFLEGALTRSETLQDHLLWQLRLQPLTEEESRLGELLIRNLDDNGFILEPPQTVAPDAPPARLAKVIVVIQAFDPPGCCTSNYSDSLLAQIRVHAHPQPGSAELVRHHMELAKRGRIAEIARHMAISEDEVRDILDFVRELDPIPGRNFSTEQVRYITPDVIVKQIDGELTLVINDEQVPVLGVNSFFEELSRDSTDRELKKFVNRNMQDARWFMRSIDERNRSLLKVARAVVEAQREFFRHGAKYLAPLTLKDVAAEVGVHEATVSRLANGKYVQTGFGVYELRYFFTNSISGAGSRGSRFSKTAVKEMLREIVEETTAAGGSPAAAKPPSDSRLAEILAEKGVRIARRTVAKYRKELDIDSSYRRS